MQVYGPAANATASGKLRCSSMFLLAHDVISFKAAAFRVCRVSCPPIPGEGVGFGELAGILDVIPDAVYHLPGVLDDGLGIVHGIEAAAVFYLL